VARRPSPKFLEAGKRRLMGDTKREATSGEVGDLRKENVHLKQLVADLLLKNQVLKKIYPEMDDDSDLA
jgi:transposase